MKQVFTNKKSELTFTKNFTSILASTKLNPLEKLIIARVLNWQENKLICQLSNNTIATELGMSVSQIKRAITNLNKLDFFKSEETSKFNEFGKWINSKKMIIDEELLFNYIESDSSPKSSKKINREVKAVEVVDEADNEIKIEFDVVAPFDRSTFQLPELTQEQIDSITDFEVAVQSKATTPETNYIDEIITLVHINKDKLNSLPKADETKLISILDSGFASKIDLTCYTSILKSAKKVA